MTNDTTRQPDYPMQIGEFWTSKQRQASSLHEISYRACFKPQLPRFFIERFSSPGDIVYDPFTGRGTTIIEAALMDRCVIGNDVNPLSRILTEPRLMLPEPGEIAHRVASLDLSIGDGNEHDLGMFFHPQTETELASLRHYLSCRRSEGCEDPLDKWIRMVATNRLTGHSPGFFSVYTLPPNQATSRSRQLLINAKRNQTPEYRDVKRLIMKKSTQLLRGISPTDRATVQHSGATARFLERDARSTPEIDDASVQLTVTSPPFLDIVQYQSDNWLRCWFNAIDEKAVGRRITMSRTLEEWSEVMQGVMKELYRITRAGGYVAFEVGEIRKGTLKLEEAIVPLGESVGFACRTLYINTQQFSKTSNIWGVRNNDHGTNTNRIVLFQK